MVDRGNVTYNLEDDYNRTNIESAVNEEAEKHSVAKAKILAHCGMF